jgi:hypothetical protein
MTNLAYMLLLIGGFCVLMLLASVGATYLALRWFHAEATKCPSCGKRGGGELVESQVVDAKRYVDWKSQGGKKGVRVEEETRENLYRCQYCGYEWTRTAEEKRHSPVKG